MHILRALFPLSDRVHIREVRIKLSARPQLSPTEFARTYFEPQTQDIAGKLYVIVQRLSGADLTGLLPTDRFVEDFRMDDLDSMSLVELAIDVEKTFDVTISDGQAATIRTFGQLVDAIAMLKQPKLNIRP